MSIRHLGRAWMRQVQDQGRGRAGEGMSGREGWGRGARFRGTEDVW